MSEHYDYHFIGIGGVGMSGLALVLLQSGKRVSGSDARNSEPMRRLAEAGAHVVVGHNGDLVNGASHVVVSSAIPNGNPELRRAREMGLPIIHRGELLAQFVNEARGIVVVGSHGKTTTTAMVASIFVKAHKDPTVFVGGDVGALRGNARAGAGVHVIAEADESDGSFLQLVPDLAVVTNIEDDHLAHYGGDRNRLIQAFRQFAGQISSHGRAFLCAEDPTTVSLASSLRAAPVSYGLTNQSVPGAVRHYTAEDVCPVPGRIGSAFRLRIVQFDSSEARQRDGYDGLDVSLLVPGRHNVQNALAALAVAAEENIRPDDALNALAHFRGAGRRFQVVGIREGVTVVDDYAHHPTEVSATLEAAHEVAHGRIIAVFQPHRYTRTRQLAAEFAPALAQADICVLLPVYAASEEPLDGVSTELIENPLRRLKADGVYMARDLSEAASLVNRLAAPGDLVLLMGAGDVNTAATMILHDVEAG